MLASVCDAQPRHVAQAPALPTPCPCPDKTGVHPQVREAWKALACGLQQQLDAVLVGHLSAVNLGFEYQALRIHEQVSLSAANLLAAIVAPLFATDPARLGRLRIDYPRTGLRVSP
jgi:hypothetical protein